MPVVSVIIPSYNHAPFLKERIASVLEQTYMDIEIILLDDASTDNSKDIIETYRDHPLVSHILYNSSNSRSPFLQWTKGIGLATGKWVWIAESDDLASPLFIEKMLAAASGKNELAFIYCDSRIRKKDATADSFAENKNRSFNTDKWSYPYYKSGRDDVNESLKWECVVNNASAVLFDRERLAGSIKDILSFRYHGDWMLYLLLADAGTIAYIPDALNVYREHASNHSASDERQQAYRIEHFRILDLLLASDYVTEKQKLFTHFLDHYIGFGFRTGPAFGKNGIFRQYAAINPGLARKVLLRLVTNKLKK